LRWLRRRWRRRRCDTWRLHRRRRRWRRRRRLRNCRLLLRCRRRRRRWRRRCHDRLRLWLLLRQIGGIHRRRIGRCRNLARRIGLLRRRRPHQIQADLVILRLIEFCNRQRNDCGGDNQGVDEEGNDCAAAHPSIHGRDFTGIRYCPGAVSGCFASSATLVKPPLVIVAITCSMSP
jgi:hypothetical protein